MHRDARRTATIILAIAAVTGVTGCAGDTPGNPPTARASGIATPGQTARHLNPADFDAAIHRSGTVVLDVRTPQEYASGHVARAVNVDLETATFRTRIGQFNRASTYAVYCRTGVRSAAAVRTMTALGFSHLYDLSGGITAWTQSGRATVTT